jgi:hypothetical protein
MKINVYEKTIKDPFGDPVTVERVDLTMPDGRVYVMDGFDVEVSLAKIRAALDKHRLGLARQAARLAGG